MQGRRVAYSYSERRSGNSGDHAGPANLPRFPSLHGLLWQCLVPEPLHAASRKDGQLPAILRGTRGTLESMQTQQIYRGFHGSAACCLDATSCATQSTTKVPSIFEPLLAAPHRVEPPWADVCMCPPGSMICMSESSITRFL